MWIRAVTRDQVPSLSIWSLGMLMYSNSSTVERTLVGEAAFITDYMYLLFPPKIMHNINQGYKNILNTTTLTF